MTESVQGLAAEVKGELKQDSQSKADAKFDTSDYNKNWIEFFNNIKWFVYSKSKRFFYPKMLRQMKVFSIFTRRRI